MDIKGLKYFISAAECLNFTHAAKECFITQTAMSQHINKMEEELGFALFIRDNRNVQLTLSGSDFYQRAKTVVRSYEDAVRRSRGMANGSEGSISIAVVSCIEGLVFMPRLQKFKQMYPNIVFSINMVQPGLILSILKSGQCDIAIGYSSEWGGEESIDQQPLASFRIGVVTRDDHPFAAMAKVKPEYIRHEKSVITGMSEYAEKHLNTVQQNLAEYNVIPKSTHEVHSLEELLMTVLLDGDIAMLPEYIKANTTGGLAFCELDMPKVPMITLSAGYMKDSQNPVVPMAINVLRDSRIPLNY